MWLRQISSLLSGAASNEAKVHHLVLVEILVVVSVLSENSRENQVPNFRGTAFKLCKRY